MAKIKVVHLQDEPTTLMDSVKIQELKDAILMRMPPGLNRYIHEEEGEIIFKFDKELKKVSVEINGFDATVAEEIHAFINGQKP